MFFLEDTRHESWCNPSGRSDKDLGNGILEIEFEEEEECEAIEPGEFVAPEEDLKEATKDEYMKSSW